MKTSQGWRPGRALDRSLIALLVASVVFAVGMLQAQDDEVEDMFGQAMMAMSKGEPREAINILGKAIARAPQRTDLYLLRSRAYDASGNYAAALKDATRVIELAPQDAEGYLSRARVHVSMNRSQLALADASKAIELAPDEPDGYYARADIYNELGRKAEADADEKRADALIGE